METNGQVRAKLDRLVFSLTDVKGLSMFALVCPDLSEGEQIQKWIRSLDGMNEVKVDIMRENILVDRWMDEEINRQASEHLTGR